MFSHFVLVSFALFLLVAIVVFFIGPRVDIDSTIHPIKLGNDLDLFLHNSEAALTDITPGTEKKIIWAKEKGVKTPVSVVYIHGFTASRQESAPLSDMVADKLGANLFYTRLTGHGRGTEGMYDASVNHWLNDAHEALEIGRRIGDKVVVIGMSAGGALSFWLSTQPGAKDVTAFVLISPSFKIMDSNTRFLLWPWGRQIAELAVGKVRCRTTHNPQHDRYWTNCYPTSALMPLKGMVKFVHALDFKSIKKPMLMIVSPEDSVIDARETIAIFEKIGSDKKELVEYDDTQDPSHHILAGEIMSPLSTTPIANIIVDFIKSLH
ncbi:MAG: alpha/beta fold hydrolase [Pseudomonadota bacterium]